MVVGKHAARSAGQDGASNQLKGPAGANHSEVQIVGTQQAARPHRQVRLGKQLLFRSQRTGGGRSRCSELSLLGGLLGLAFRLAFRLFAGRHRLRLRGSGRLGGLRRRLRGPCNVAFDYLYKKGKWRGAGGS